ncbi:MAG: FHA domain-containing protein [Caldilinea sp.]|nr:FHA domain-containing protein [Caldilinea sp.]MCB0058395.1 FHA domain-containing protein [Caldilineaceae bacterium]MCB0049030.1 FHA domain-containing protein [Caldilinea sp.]MCB0069098.1 FHA domain-containing protein [Caldilineaceae bacterium]MCB0146593.1 FHA domain-containing protein [Caldilineaceae bacterium]
MNCPTCGTEILPGDPFCDNCGADLRSQQPSSDPTPEPPVVEDSAMRPGEQAASPVEGQSQPTVVTPTTPPALTASGPRLVVKDDGATIPLAPGKELIVGRTDPIDGIFPDIDLTPHDTLTGVSRRHAAIHEQGGQWFVRDLNSTNYTVVNRQRLQPDQDFLIEAGDEIRFGRLVTHFQS